MAVRLAAPLPQSLAKVLLEGVEASTLGEKTGTVGYSNQGDQGNMVGEALMDIEVVSQPSKPLYASIVQNKSTLLNHDLKISMVDGSPTVESPDDILEGSAPMWDKILIRKFLATAPHIAKVHVIVNKIWTLGDKNLKVDVFAVDQTTMKFKIHDSSARNRVIRRGMWNIANITMIVSKWFLVSEEAQLKINTMPMWIVLKNVPHKMFHWKGLGFFASAIGVPQKFHPHTEMCKSFDEAKMFVETNLSKKLPKKLSF